ncbi:MAG: response regulator [Thermoplasmatota archaeon]
MTDVLIVDDEPFIHQLYRDILEFTGFNIVGEAYDGDEAVRVYNEMDGKPDVIIMDQRMPNQDGLETMVQIMELDPDVKVIFASADSSVRDKALEYGAIKFLCKPFQINDLVTALQTL